MHDTLTLGEARKDNLGSRHVLEKCGFVMCGEQKEYSELRDEEVEEYKLTLA